MSLTQQELDFWNNYISKEELEIDISRVSASIAGNDEIANDLLQLYLDGKKSAGSSLLRDYEVAGDDLPKVGDFWIILDKEKTPKCIVKTVQVEQYKFSEVPEEVAIAEGEGDLSLEFWRKAHIEFFTPYLSELGIDDLSNAIIVTEFYDVVFKA